MGNSKGKSFTGQVQLLLKTKKDFPQNLKQRLVLQSNNVRNPLKFIGTLLTKGVLSDGSSDQEASFGLKEMMVQLAMMIACAKGADAIGGLMEALEGSGNSQLILCLQNWVKMDFGIQTDGELSEPKDGDLAMPTQASEKLPQNRESCNEMNPTGIKLIDKIMSRIENDFMEQLEGHLVCKASQIENVEEFHASLVDQKVLDKADKKLVCTAEPEVQLIEKLIKAACSKKAIGSLVIALQRSDSDSILKETHEWLESSQVGKNNYPISVKSLAKQRIEEESKAVRSTFFEQAALSDELSKIEVINCQPKSATKGTTGVQFDKERMMARSTNGTLHLWNWRDSKEEPIQVAVKVKNIACFQYDEEVLVLGTAEGTVHLFDGRTFEEKWTVRLGEAAISLKFIGSTLVIITIDNGYHKFWWINISRSDMRLCIQWSTRQIEKSKSIPLIFMYPDVSFVYGGNVINVYDTKTGSPITDNRKRHCCLRIPDDICALNVGNLISTKRVVVAGFKNGSITMWNTSNLMYYQMHDKSCWGHTTAVVTLCFLKGHLLSLDQNGNLLMWSGYDLESFHKPVPRVLMENSYFTNLDAHERWFASSSCKDDSINIWTMPDLWLRTG